MFLNGGLDNNFWGQQLQKCMQNVGNQKFQTSGCILGTFMDD